MTARDSLGPINRHFWLTRSVARCIGVSLTEAMAMGQLSEPDYARMVTNCRRASCADMCQAWLAEQTTIADEAPLHCANAKMLNNLRQNQEQ